MLNKFAAAELEQITRNNGGLLLPEKVIERARKKDSALHPFFEWDAKKAQESFHLLVARRLIRAYEVYVEMKDTGEKEKVRAFVSLSTDRRKEGGYRLLTEVLDDEGQRSQLLQDAFGELEAFQRKYRRLNQLNPVFEAIEQVRTVSRRASEELRATA